MRPTSLRIVVADDQPVARTAIGRALAAAGHVVIGEASRGDEALDVVERLRPDVAVLDIRMPPTLTDEGLQAAAGIEALRRGVGVVVLSQYLEAIWAIRLLDRRTAGTAYLLKDRIADVATLDGAVRTAADGGSVVDDVIVERLLRRESERLRRLTDRERTVLALMAQGRSNAGIAEDLHLTPKTVESHVRAIFSKLDVAVDSDAHRRVRAVLLYLETAT